MHSAADSPDFSDLLIRPFRPEDQAAARQLILADLEERWGKLDPSLNPDLEDIAASYAEGLFLVAFLGGRLVGTGAVLRRGEEAWVCRMSVAAELRRRGLGRQILERLAEQARAWGCSFLRLETTATWRDAAAFYLSQGFQPVEERGGDIYFEKPLTA